jgi:hypothetical protein
MPGSNRFSAGWLAGNGLIGMNNAGTIVKEGDGRIQVGAVNTFTANGSSMNAGTLNFNAGNINFNPMAPQVAQGKAKESLQKDLAESGRQSGKMPQQQQQLQQGFDDNRAVQTYERRLREQAGRGGISDRESAARPKTESIDAPYAAAEMNQIARDDKGAEIAKLRNSNAKARIVNTVDGDTDDTIMTNPSFRALAGLDIKIPTRGKLYRFTTPLGDADITGRPVATTLVADGYRAAAVIGVLLVLAVVWRVGRKLRWTWFRDTKLGAAALIVVGILGLLTFTLPLIAGLLVLMGLVFLLRPRSVEFVAVKPAG